MSRNCHEAAEYAQAATVQCRMGSQPNTVTMQQKLQDMEAELLCHEWFADEQVQAPKDSPDTSLKPRELISSS